MFVPVPPRSESEPRQRRYAGLWLIGLVIVAGGFVIRGFHASCSDAASSFGMALDIQLYLYGGGLLLLMIGVEQIEDRRGRAVGCCAWLALAVAAVAAVV